MYYSYLHFKRKSGLVSLAVLASCLWVHPLVAMDKEENSHPCSTPIKSSSTASFDEQTEQIDSKDLIYLPYNGKTYEVNSKIFLEKIPLETRKKMDGVFEYHKKMRQRVSSEDFRDRIIKMWLLAPSEEEREEIIDLLEKFSTVIDEIKRTENQKERHKIQNRLHSKKDKFFKKYTPQIPSWERNTEKDSYMLEALRSNAAKEVSWGQEALSQPPALKKASKRSSSDLELSVSAKKKETVQRKKEQVELSKVKVSEKGRVTELEVSYDRIKYTCNLEIIAQKTPEDKEFVKKVITLLDYLATPKRNHKNSSEAFQIFLIRTIIYSPKKCQSKIEEWMDKRLKTIEIIKDQKSTKQEKTAEKKHLTDSKKKFFRKISQEEWLQHPAKDSRFWKYEKIMNNSAANSGVVASSGEYNPQRFEEDASSFMPKAKKRKINRETSNETTVSIQQQDSNIEGAASITGTFNYPMWSPNYPMWSPNYPMWSPNYPAPIWKPICTIPPIETPPPPSVDDCDLDRYFNDDIQMGVAEDRI